MSLTTDKLLSKIQTIQGFFSKCSLDNLASKYFDEAIKELGENLETGKLTLQIVEHDSAQLQSLQKLLKSNSDLYDTYQVRTSTLPEIPDPDAPPPTPVLILESSAKIQQLVQYKLQPSQNQIIGRNPSAAQILLRDNLSLISGSHAEVHLLGDGTWQIRDLGSRNGTFINGSPTKLQDWHPLKNGDLISLGSASQAEGSATLLFEVPAIEDNRPALAEAQKLLNCNILCLVIPAQPLSDNIRRFIQLVKDNSFIKFWLIVDKPGNITDDAFREVFAGIESSLKKQLQDIPFELTSLLLKPFIPSSGATVLTPHAQPEFEKFCAKLKGITQESLETTLVKWGTNKLNQIVHQLEDILVQQSFIFQENLEKDEEKFKELSQGKLKRQIEKVYKKIDGERDSFFRQIKTEFSQSKANLLDEFRQSSISYKIQKFTKQLQPQISDQGIFRYIRLKVRSKATVSKITNDVHLAATELCHTELAHWSSTEWNRIQNDYISGGLDSFLKRSYEYLNFMPELGISEDGFSSTQTLSIQSILNGSIVEPMVELRYKQVGFWGYMFKNLRGQIITVVGTVTMLGSGLIPALPFDVKVLLVPSLFPITLAMVWISYKQEKEAKVEEVTEKLQKETSNYYQSYVKGLVDRISQRITGLIDAEERTFRETLENVKEIYASHITELDKTQSQLKSQIDEMKRSGQTKIEKDLVELRKLKQSLLS